MLIVQGDDLHPVIRLDARIETAQEIAQSRARQAIAALDQHINEGHSILDSCGQPRQQMVGADPMHFQEQCIPRINKFGADCRATINRMAPEFKGEFDNVGNVTHNTDLKAAMVQTVEPWLENIRSIQKELRTRL